MVGNRIGNFLGIAKSAGKLSLGSENVIQSIQNNSCYMVILAEDIGPRTQKTIMDKCAFYQVNYRSWGTKQELSQYLGTSPLSAIAIKDHNFVVKINTLLDSRE